MGRRAACWLTAAALCLVAGCGHDRAQPSTLTFLIESSPANLDPRIGTDAQSERIDELLFDGLVQRGANFALQPSLALSWENPTPLTWMFHLRNGVFFHDGRTLTSRDVKWTLDSMRDHSIVSPKTGAFSKIASVEAPDAATIVLHLSSADPALLWNLSDGAFGVIPAQSDRNFGRHPVGSGPFRFVSEEIDREVVIERASSWHAAPRLQRVRFSVVPDAITRALELRKGSADVALSSLTPDMVRALAADPRLRVQTAPGTVLAYLAFNLRDPLLRDARIRRAIAVAVNRPLIVRTLLGGNARLATSMLPPSHWAFDPDQLAQQYDPAAARAILDAAGYRPGAGGVRFSIAMKTSTDEGTRQFAAVLQQQLRDVGIDLQLRSYEFATFYADVTSGAFQMYSLRWVGGNEDPDIFQYAFSSRKFPPNGANRGRYSNPQFDALLEQASLAGSAGERRADYIAAQKILARDLPAFNLWYLDNVAVINRRVQGVELSTSGDFRFLETAWLQDAR